MPDPSVVFQVANTLALLAWVALLASLFWTAARPTVWPTTGIVIPGLYAVAYVVLLLSSLGEGSGGGFGSIAEVRTLFTSDAALTAGWLHYLAFDLFVGSWIARDGTTRGLPGWMIAPCLGLCFLFGPAGLLLYLLLRLAGRPA